MQIPGYDSLTFEQFTEKFNRAKIKASIKAQLGHYSEIKVKEGKEISYQNLSTLTGLDVKTLHNWSHGRIKQLPPEEKIVKFCDDLRINKMYFANTATFSEEEQKIISNLVRADGIGINECFVQFLRDERRLHDQIAILIEESEDGYTDVQFSDPFGKKMYPDRRTALVIKCVQNETVKLISERIKEICLISNTFQNAELFDSYLERLAGASDMEEMHLAPFVDEELAQENVIWDKGEDEDGHA